MASSERSVFIVDEANSVEREIYVIFGRSVSVKVSIYKDENSARSNFDAG